MKHVGNAAESEVNQRLALKHSTVQYAQNRLAGEVVTAQ
jgi:hypothetical protein